MPAPTNAHSAAKERFYRAAIWWCSDQSCSNALAELEDAYEALSALSRQRLTETLRQKAEAA